MPDRQIGIVIDGATGRLGTTQHLRALLATRGEGGLPLANGERLIPEPVLLGRNPEKLAALAEKSGGLRWSTDRDACLADPAIDIYFDATATGGRVDRARAAFAAGKHVYLEKPIAENLEHTTAQPRRIDESRKPYDVDVEDHAFAIFELEGGVLAQISSSWASRVKRDDLLQIQVDGTLGSAVAGLHRCFVQPLVATPKPFFSPEQPQQMNFDEQWQEVPDVLPFENGYRAGWQLFLRHVAEDAPFSAPLLEGAKSVQLAEACYKSDRERRWVELEPLSL